MTGSFIVAKSFERRKTGFHDILLPRSWVADLVEGNSHLVKDTGTLELFVPIFRGLLGQLYAAGDSSSELLPLIRSNSCWVVNHMFVSV